MENMISLAFMQVLLFSTFRMATPLLLTAMGELYDQRAGMINIGLDGIMTIGAVTAFIGNYYTGSPWIGIMVGILSGIAFNLIYALCTITLRAGQIIIGMAMNILAPGLATFLYRMCFGVSGNPPHVENLENIPIPILSDIPLIGQALFCTTPIVYLSYLMLIATSIFFNRTHAGLNFRSVGEYPKASESLGINVIRVKYIACILCGALGGLGGAFLTSCYVGTYTEGLISGRGFIALSAVIFGRWSQIGILIATLIFGFADALQLRLQVFIPDMPYQIFAMLPYLCTFFALALAKGKDNGPRARGKVYMREGE